MQHFMSECRKLLCVFLVLSRSNRVYIICIGSLHRICIFLLNLVIYDMLHIVVELMEVGLVMIEGRFQS